MHMKIVMKVRAGSILEAAACALALATSACGAAPSAEDSSAIDSTTQELSSNLLAGPWQFASENFDPASFNASTVYGVNGNAINFTYQGKGPFTVTGPAPSSGIHFTQPVQVVQGGAYRLELSVTNLVGASPTLFWASLSGATSPSSTLPIIGNATGVIDFVVSSAPGATPTIELVNTPITVRPGIGLQNFTVTATLTKTN
jgi:hypothetical protein